MRSVLLCIGAMLGSLNVFASSSRQQTHLVLDEQKLQDLMKAFDLVSSIWYSCKFACMSRTIVFFYISVEKIKSILSRTILRA